MSDEEPKKTFRARWVERICSWTGIGGFSERMDDLSSPWKSFYKENRDRLSDNLENADEISAQPFTKVLKHWGIYSVPALQQYIQSKKHNIYAGAFLFLFGGIGALFQPARGMLGYLSTFSCISVATLGAILIATSWWRLDVIRKKKFIAFDKWLMKPFSRQEKNNNAAKCGGNKKSVDD